MTAKPEPMAGQSDAADDLIAELAKLMAQDAKGDGPATVPSPSFSVRIPGGDTDTVSHVDLDSPAPPPRDLPAAAVTPVLGDKPDVKSEPEPFKFDFDFGLPKAASDVLPAPAAGATSAVPPPRPAAEAATGHDSIADLIAAELLAEPAPEAEPQSAPKAEVQPEPVAETSAEPVVAVPPRSVPQPNAGWMPTTVAPGLDARREPAMPALRALNLQPGSRPAQDRFSVSPVFGVGTKPVASEPAVSAPVPYSPTPAAAPVEPPPVMRPSEPSLVVAPHSAPQDDELGGDPIDEIEHLIGRAMRVEFDKPAAAAVAPVSDARPAPSPALRTLATPVSTPSEPAAASRALSGADEAIFAAAQASGAHVGWVEAPEVDELADEPVAAKRPVRQRRGFTRAMAGPLVAVTLLLAAGFGLFWVLGLGRDSGPAPLLTADASPIKETPEVQPGAAATQQSVVFNEIDGVVPGAEEQLVSRDQADVNEVTQVPPVAELSEEGLANRKVRTVTVRPDGTIVSGEDSVAGSAILPVDRPVVPTVPGADTTIPDLLANADAEAAASATPAVAATPTPVTAVVPGTTAEPAAAITPLTPGSMVPAVDASGNPVAGKSAPVPMSRPSGLQATAPSATAGALAPAVVTTPTASTGNTLPPPPTNSTLGALPTAQPAATQPVVAQPVAATNSTATNTIPGAVEVDAVPNNAPAYAQLASLRSEEEARQTAQRLVTRFGPLFGGANMEVQRVDLGARGIYYRVRVPAASTAAAVNICANVVAAGGDCVQM